MSEKPEGTSDQQQAQAEALESSLDTVREILFGQQAREHDQRAKALDDKFSKTLKALEKQVNDQFKAVEKSITRLQADLTKQAEKTAAEIAAEFKDTRATIDALEKATQTAHSDLHEQLSSEREALEKRAQQWNEDLAKQLELVQAQLQHTKADRASLGTLLHQMADSLTADLDQAE